MNRSCQTGLACFFLAAIILAIFYPVNKHDFINMDDPFFVEDHHVPEGLSLKNIKRSFTLHYGMWMPLTWLSHMADCHLYGPRPAGHHLTSLLVHLVNTVLLFLLLRSMTGAFYKSLTVAALFAMHPLNVEPAAYIACRKDLLAAFFWMLTILAYTHYARRSSTKQYISVCLCFSLGLMAKPVMVTLPLILLLLDYWPLNRFQGKSLIALIKEKLPLLAASVIIGLITIITQQEAEALSGIPLSGRIGNALISYMTYLGHIFWPSGLAIFYPWPQRLSCWKTTAAGALLLLITYSIISRRKESPYAIVGWFWFIIVLLPVNGVIPVGSHAMADRYAYIPGIGIFMVIAWSAEAVFKPWRVKKPLIILSVLIVLIALGFMSRRQLGHWQNSETVFRHALTVTDNNYAAHNNLARALLERGLLEEARSHLNRALMIHPDFPQAHNNLGVLLAAQKKTDLAQAHFETAIEYRPDFTEAHYNMANELFAAGSHTTALNHYKKVLDINPSHKHAADIHFRIGLIMAARQRTEKAMTSFQQALSIDSGHIEAAEKLADIYKTTGQYDQAIALYQRLIQKRPDCSISIAYNLACLFSLKKDPATAMAWLKKSVSVSSRCSVQSWKAGLPRCMHTISAREAELAR